MNIKLCSEEGHHNMLFNMNDKKKNVVVFTNQRPQKHFVILTEIIKHKKTDSESVINHK